MRYFEIFLLIFYTITIYCCIIVNCDTVELTINDDNHEDNNNLHLTTSQNNPQQQSEATNERKSNKNNVEDYEAEEIKRLQEYEAAERKRQEGDLKKLNEPNELMSEFVRKYSPIKIVEAPNLAQEKDAAATGQTDESDATPPTTDNDNDVTTIKNDDKDQIQVTGLFIQNLIEKRLEWVKKLEEQFDNLDEILMEEDDKPPRKLLPFELKLEELYESAMKIINKSRSTDKLAGYDILLDAANQGHAKSSAKIAWAHLFGNPLELNIEKARQIFLELADLSGFAEAHMGLGFMYATGLGFNVSQARALVHYTMAAAGGDQFAQMVLGYRYWAGVTVPSSCETALDFYRKVATGVAEQVTFSGGAAIHRIRLLDEIENSGLSANIVNNDVIEYYQLLADKGDVQTQVGLGQLHYQGGHGIPVDHQRALHYFLPAANAGNAIAMAFLGKIYLEGSEHIKADNETAFKYFLKAAELGNPVGQSGLGLMYLQGKGVSKDTAKAYNYFTQAAEQGWVDGQLQLGNMYFSGIGVKRDFKLANKYFNLASQSGHVLAYYNLGQMHAVGLGIVRSCPMAVELFKNVAERGRWSERLMIAHQDYKSYRFDSAFIQYAFAGELGYEVAQSNAAFILDRGEITLFDENRRYEELVRALQYWGRAASQGYSAAQVKLGDYHYYGLGTAVDYEAAASHYRMASDTQHNAQAMFNLGYMHEQGLGMEKDWHLAKRCYDLAAETSVDAKVPVALALLKLSFMFKLESLKQGPLRILLELDENFASNWDLYLITALTMLLGFVIYMRRPMIEQQNPPAAQPADDGNQQQTQQPPPAPQSDQPAPAPPANNPNND